MSNNFNYYWFCKVDVRMIDFVYIIYGGFFGDWLYMGLDIGYLFGL